MSKKKAPALHERRGREDISTRPPRLAGYPIKLAGKARLRRLSLAADSCVNRKYYGGDPGVGQRKSGVHTIPPSRHAPPKARRKVSARSSPGSHEEHIKCSSARAESTKTLRLAFGGAACVDFGQPGFSLADAPTHNAWVGGLMCCVPLGYKVEMKVDRRFRPSSKSWSETQ